MDGATAWLERKSILYHEVLCGLQSMFVALNPSQWPPELVIIVAALRAPESYWARNGRRQIHTWTQCSDSVLF